MLEWEGLCIMYHHFEMSKKTRQVINKDMEEQKDYYHVGVGRIVYHVSSL
jgi:hypothetical protein